MLSVFMRCTTSSSSNSTVHKKKFFQLPYTSSYYIGALHTYIHTEADWIKNASTAVKEHPKCLHHTFIRTLPPPLNTIFFLVFLLSILLYYMYLYFFVSAKPLILLEIIQNLGFFSSTFCFLVARLSNEAKRS